MNSWSLVPPSVTDSASIPFKTLGNSDLKLSPLGLGGWAFGGGDWAYSLGPQDDRDSIAAIHSALDHGINWIDTAAVYGLGHSEEVIGKAIRSASTRPHIFSKCGIPWRQDGTPYNSLKADSLIKEVEDSLRRLRVDSIDLYQVHWGQPDCEIEEGWEALARCREQGKIRWIGVSNFTVAQMKRAQKIAPMTSVQPPYSLLDRRIEAEVLPFAQANGIGVINSSPMASGILAGKLTREMVAALPAGDSRRHSAQFREPRLSRNLQLVALLREIGNDNGVSPGVVAIAWILHNPAITGVIAGARNRAQLEQLAIALHFRLTEREYERIGRFLKSIRWNLARLYCRLASRS